MTPSDFAGFGTRHVGRGGTVTGKQTGASGSTGKARHGQKRGRGRVERPTRARNGDSLSEAGVPAAAEMPLEPNDNIALSFGATISSCDQRRRGAVPR